MRVNPKKMDLFIAKKGCELYELAKLSGVAYTTLNRVRNGHGTTPATVGKIANALNCNPADLIE